MINFFCLKITRANSQNKIKCRLEKGHEGRCDPHPFLKHLKINHRNIADKIKQDAYHSRGNKTKPFKNRSFRWDRSISKVEALRLKDQKALGIPKKEHASQEECFRIARKLTRLIYEMEEAPECPEEISRCLDKIPDKRNNPCLCPLCLEQIVITDFNNSSWGQATVELWHIEPLRDSENNHNEENLGWGHRTCNIAQQERNTEETVEWMNQITQKHKRITEKGQELVN